MADHARTAGDDVETIVAWFLQRGLVPDFAVGHDGAHRAAFAASEHVRRFGTDDSRLQAARGAQAMPAGREGRDALERNRLTAAAPGAAALETSTRRDPRGGLETAGVGRPLQRARSRRH